MGTDKERTPTDEVTERPMTVEYQDGVKKTVPKHLTALEREYMALLVWRSDDFATAEEFNAIVTRHLSPESSLLERNNAAASLRESLINWGYVVKSPEERAVGSHTFYIPPSWSITDYGKSRVSKELRH